MNIIVCIKQTPDTESLIRIDSSDKTRIVEKELQFIINPYDEYAIEEALQIKENAGEGNVTAITIGPERAQSSLRDALAMGVDDVIHIWDDRLEGIDGYGSALILSEVIKQMDFNLILCGKQSVDDDAIQIPSMLSEFLDIPQVQFITNLEVDVSKNKVTATQEIDGGSAIISATMPVLLSCQKGLNEPRYPSLRGKMAAKKTDIPIKSLTEIGLPGEVIDEVSKKRSVIEELSTPPPRTAGEIIEGEPEEVVSILIEKLKERKVL